MGGVFLSQPNKQKKTKKYQHQKIRVVTCEMQGWRKNMQDAVLYDRISKQIFLFGIFDGHGGVQVAQYVSRNISKILQNQPMFKEKKYQEALGYAFRDMDELIKTEQAEKQLRQITVENGMQPFEDGAVADSVGCTAIVVLMVQNTLYVANAGDSRVGLSRKGKFVPLSIDHKPQDQDQKKRITAAGWKVENGRINAHLNLSRSFGDLHYKKTQGLPYDQQAVTCKPDVQVIQLDKNDEFLLMGCDGVWQRYEQNGQGLIDIIRQDRMTGKDPETVLQSMLDSFLASNTKTEQLGCDNMSAILIQFNRLML